jgi:hypothetical protein
VIDRAVPPREKSSPKRRLTVMVVFLIGGVIGVAGALTREYVEGAERRQPEDYDELKDHWSAAKSELKQAMRLFRRGRPR